MAKILVADDNSNIQKMVGLALKDQGIDVVAVGNGEAAVRKISDIKPDLVLADVFMPVRNGYEVCQYVKEDPALAHIPVILLVGAFDPLDEQEAQRVGADGVLKKPFVPPDPLIAMVKAALTRAGVSLTAGGADKTEKAGKKASDILAPKPKPVPVVVAAPPPPEPEPMAFEEMEGLVEEVSVQPPPVDMRGGAPLAFGNLMNATETADEDAAFSAPVHPELERDFRAEEGDDVPEEEEEEEPKSSWRRDADEEVAAKSGKNAGSNWRDVSFADASARKSAREDWESGAERPAMTEAAATPVSAGANLAEMPTAISVVHEEAARETEKLPALSGDAWAAAISAGSAENGNGAARNGSAPLGGSPLEAEQVPSYATETEGPAPGHAEAATQAFEHEAVATAIDRFAGVAEGQEEAKQNSPERSGAWEVQALKANQLAATWDTLPSQAAVASVPVEEQAPVSAVLESPVAEAAVENVPAEMAAIEPVTHEAEAPVAAMNEETVSDLAGAVDAESAYASAAEPIAEVVDNAEKPVLDEPVVQALVEAQVEAAQSEGAEQQAAHDSFEAAVESPIDTAVADEIAAVKSQETHTTDGSAAAVSTEDVVARVLASLSPEVMQAVTRELLKPVVEAMVREELNKKK